MSGRQSLQPRQMSTGRGTTLAATVSHGSEPPWKWLLQPLPSLQMTITLLASEAQPIRDPEQNCPTELFPNSDP